MAKGVKATGELPSAAFCSLPSLERSLPMLIAYTYLPGCVTMVFRGMPTVWRGRHRLIFCWLIFMQAVSPGRKTLAEMARWTPATLTAWRFGRLLKAASWNVHLLVSWLAQDLVATLPAPANGILYSLAMAAMPTNGAPRILSHRKGVSASIIPGFLACASSC